MIRDIFHALLRKFTVVPSLGMFDNDGCARQRTLVGSAGSPTTMAQSGNMFTSEFRDNPPP